MKYPNVFQLHHLQKTAEHVHCKLEGTEAWIPARPEGYAWFGARIKAAWLVFTGRADAVIWPGGQ